MGKERDLPLSMLKVTYCFVLSAAHISALGSVIVEAIMYF
jgi:hypothetical protein